MAAIGALFAGSTLGIGNVHMVFANRGINVQTSTNQDQECEPAGGTSGITNACTSTSTPGTQQTQVQFTFASCTVSGNPDMLSCNTPVAPNFCNNIGCQSITCSTFVIGLGFTNCVANGVQFTRCIVIETLPGTMPPNVSCIRTEPGTGITSSGGVTGGDGG